MKLPTYLMAAAALSMAAAPAFAAPTTGANTLSVGQNARVGSAKGDEKLAGGGLIIAIVAAVAVVVGAVVVATNGDDKPDSP